MQELRRTGKAKFELRSLIRWAAATLLGGIFGCTLAYWHFRQLPPSSPVVAFIPRTTGSNYTEDMRRGAQEVAQKLGYRIYWNAPTREDDLDRQIEIAEAAVRRGAKALILGPTNPGGVTTLINELIARRIPVVVVETEAPVPTGPYLTSVTANQDEFGHLAVKRIEHVIGGAGQVAIVGLDPGAPETLIRARSFMQAVAADPGIEVVAQLPSSVQILEAEQSTREILSSYPRLRAIFAVSAEATQGAMLALHDLDRQQSIALVGCDRDWFLEDDLREGKLDSVVTADPNRIGELAMRAAVEGAEGHPLPFPEKVDAFLLTQDGAEQANNR